jgi:hypothetical protein
MQSMMLAQYQGPQHSRPSRVDSTLARQQPTSEVKAPPSLPAAAPQVKPHLLVRRRHLRLAPFTSPLSQQLQF